MTPSLTQKKPAWTKSTRRALGQGTPHDHLHFGFRQKIILPRYLPALRRPRFVQLSAFHQLPIVLRSSLLPKPRPLESRASSALLPRQSSPSVPILTANLWLPLYISTSLTSLSIASMSRHVVSHLSSLCLATLPRHPDSRGILSPHIFTHGEFT